MAMSRWPAGAVLAGIALSYVSSFGQNFLLAVFGGEFRAAFGLSHGGFGLLYTGVTLGSAVALLVVGRSVDRLPLSLVAAGTLGVLAGASLLLSMATHVAALALALLLLRLFGQGMAMQLSATAAARWFGHGSRGRALGAAGLGNPLGEATLPILAVLLMAALGWRQAWALGALALVLVAVPLVLLIRHVERLATLSSDGSRPAGDSGEPSWSVGRALRHPVLWLLLPGLLAPVTINVAVFFHQVAISEAYGWDPAWFVAFYPLSAGATVVASLASGWLIDRFGAASLLPYVLLPMLVAVLLLAGTAYPAVIPAYLGLAGAAMGAAMPLQAAVLVETYGAAHFGAIRALVVAVNVVLGALGPGVAGVLADAGLAFSAQLQGSAIYLAACMVMLVVGKGASRRLAARRRQVLVNPT